LAWTGQVRRYSNGAQPAGFGTVGNVGNAVLEPLGVVVVVSPPRVVVVDTGSVIEVLGGSVVEVSSLGAVVEGDGVGGVVVGLVVVGLLGGRLVGGSGGNRSSMVTGAHMTAASTEAGAPPTTYTAAVNVRTAKAAAPNLPDVMEGQANQMRPCWEPGHPG